jgi:hypothetical protein
MKLINTSLLLGMLLQVGINTQIYAAQDPRFHKISEGELKNKSTKRPLILWSIPV